MAPLSPTTHVAGIVTRPPEDTPLPVLGEGPGVRAVARPLRAGLVPVILTSLLGTNLVVVQVAGDESRVSIVRIAVAA